MKRIFTLKLNHMLKKSLTCITMLAVVAIALASSGGGKNKSASSNNLGIVPVTARGAFTLKAKPSYSGSHLLSTLNLKNSTVYRSIITYQKGNTIFIVPSRYRVSNAKLSFNSGPALRSNLNMVDLRLKLCR
jgi:hypothetical protein